VLFYGAAKRLVEDVAGYVSTKPQAVSLQESETCLRIELREDAGEFFDL
jgi:hypothetical protein